MRILWFMSLRVSAPSPHGFTNANGRTTDDVVFVGVLMKDFFPVRHTNAELDYTAVFNDVVILV